MELKVVVKVTVSQIYYMKYYLVVVTKMQHILMKTPSFFNTGIGGNQLIVCNELNNRHEGRYGKYDALR
jgi:hypothetical protein